ncbi:Helicase SEN1 [Meyerozyma sp. JA9]|nr:Helicase SEN1 [Meyerozyma sp. JA9]
MHDSIKPEGYDELVTQIENSHKDATNSALQENVLKACVNYLYTNQENVHWFCDRYMNRMAVHTLILFSFTDNNVLQWLKPKFAEYINSCEKCSVAFYEGISQLRHDFLMKRAISVKQVHHFLDVILSWRAKILEDKITTFFKDTSASDLPFNGISECLICPDLIRSHTSLKHNFSKLFQHLQEHDILDFPSHLLSGTIFLALEGTELERKWAFQWLESLKSKECRIYTEDSLSRLVVEEFSKHLYKIQDAKYFTPEFCAQFWKLFSALIHILSPSSLLLEWNTPYDIEVMSQHINIRLYPLLRVFANNLLAQLNEPIPILLKVFSQLLSMLKCEFWENMKPYIFINILDTLLVNPHYIEYLGAKPISFEATRGRVSGLAVNWILPFLDSLTGIQYQTASIRISKFLFKHSPDISTWTPEVSINPSSILLPFMACYILQENLKDATPSSSKLEIATADLVKRRDVRAAIDEHANTITRLTVIVLGDAFDDTIHSIPRQLVFDSISYDCRRLSVNSKMIQLSQTPTYSESFMEVIRSTVERKIYLHPELIGAWLGAFDNTCQIVRFEEKKQDNAANKEFLAFRHKHNNQVEEYNSYVRRFLETASLADQNVLRAIFTKTDAQAGFWSCLFSSSLSASAVNILYEMFDVGVGGRYEAIQALLTGSISETLNAVSINLSKLTQLEAFESCPKTVRILMDVFKALTDPLNDLLSFSNHPSGKEGGAKDILNLWSSSWLFLEMIYKRTLAWASFYHLEQLIEFARDTLDLSHIILDSFRLVLQSINESMGNALFSVFFNAFNSMIVWLRLGDPALLNSCVELVFKGFALAKDLQYSIDDDFIENFARYGAKAKKFNNKLSDQQRLKILSTAKEFNYDLVESIIVDVQKQRSKESIPVNAKTSSASPTPEIAQVPTRYGYQMSGPKQQSLTKFGIITSQPPVAPPPPQTQFKSASLEAIRQGLSENRTQQVKHHTSKPTVVAPPRQAGFNPRKVQPVVGRSLNSLKRKKDSDSEDDGDEDGDVDVSDLFVEKKKKAKIVELDINGRPVVKPSQLSKVDQKRREEDNMRMRLNVNLKPLYSTILKWNFASSDKYPTADRERYKETRSNYEDVKDYVKSMEPLLMLECWQGIISSKETSQESPFTMLVGSRTSVDGFFDVYASIEKKILNDRKITDSDLLVLSYIDNALQRSEKELAAHIKSSKSTTCLAKVREIKSANADYADVTLRVFPQGTMMGVLTPKSVVIGMKVMQMITIEREYSSLRGLEYYNLCPEILRASPAGPIEVPKQKLEDVMTNYKVNESQANAIISTHNRNGFSLIQGPPGTGKTKTILGIVGYNLSKDIPSGIIEIDGQQGKPQTNSKILVCAPSNAAVDELVVRLRDGVFNFKGERITPSVVRLGRSDAVNSAVRDLTLEELVDKQLQTTVQHVARDPEVRAEHTKLVKERDSLRQSLQNSNLSEEEFTQMESRLREVNKKRNELAKKLDEQRENAAVAYRSRELERRQLQAKILNSSQIICSTLSGSAHDFLSSLGITFEKVIIDEACQCVELSAIIPLRYGCTKCIMVGDPKQLPPTVLSQTAASLSYDKSLFVRMQEQYPDSAYLLDVQYRMHPDISRFPSAEFYRSKLHDGDGMLEKNRRPWHSEVPFSPYRFFDIVGKHQQHESSRSLYNRAEAQVVLEMVEHLMYMLPSKEFRGRIGVISPYKEQIRTLKDIFGKKYGRQIWNEIDFNTVDGYQGQEKEIIIMSCVRASETGNVGFLSDVRRMNVALTRARTTLWILGNAKSLMRNNVWSRLLQDASERGLVSEAKPGFLKRGVNGMQKGESHLSSKTDASSSNNRSDSGMNSKPNLQIKAAHPSKQMAAAVTNGANTSKTHNADQEAKLKSSIFNQSEEKQKNRSNGIQGGSKKAIKKPYIAELGPSSSKVNENMKQTDEKNASNIKPTTSGVLPKPKSKQAASIFINNRKRRK